MAQTTQTTQTQSRPRGQAQQQQAPQQAPTDNLPATQGRPRGQAAGQQQQQPNGGGTSTRGMSATERGNLAMSNLVQVSEAFLGHVDRWADKLLESIPQSARELAFFKQVLATAAAEKPELYFADKRTLFNAARKCFLDGLLPDSRDAALVVFNTKLKVRAPDGVDTEISIAAVQYMPMVRGITRRMLESGGVESAYADAVYSEDEFKHVRGDQPRIFHETPPLGFDRGELIGAYAVINLANGRTLLDSMGKKEIMASKAKSRSVRNDGSGKSMLWDDFPWEAYKKTVLRRLSKSAPVAPNIHRIVDRDEEPIDGEVDHLGNLVGAPRYDHAPSGSTSTYHHVHREPEAPVNTGGTAPNGANGTTDNRPLDQVIFSITDLEGQVHEFEDPFKAYDAFPVAMDAAQKMGVDRLDGFWGDNQDLLDQLSASGNDNLATELAQRFTEARDRAEQDQRNREAAAAEEQAERERQADAERQRKAEQDAAELEERNRAAREADARAVAQRQAQEQQPEPDGNRAPHPADAPSAAQNTPAADVGDDRPSRKIDMPIKGNKPDMRTWCLALLIPKIKRTMGTTELAELLGDNTQNYELCRDPKGPLDGPDRLQLIKVVEEQFKKLPGDS